MLPRATSLGIAYSHASAVFAQHSEMILMPRKQTLHTKITFSSLSTDLGPVFSLLQWSQRQFTRAGRHPLNRQHRLLRIGSSR